MCARPCWPTPVAAIPGNQLDYSTYRLLSDTIRMADMFGPGSCPARFSSVMRLGAVHDELAGRLNPGNGAGAPAPLLAAALPERFPPPPFPGMDGVSPITGMAELLLEGREMRHCIGAYASEVAEGDCYIYRVTEPARATAAIFRSGTRWRLGEVKKAFNGDVSLVDRLAIQNALFKRAAPEA